MIGRKSGNLYARQGGEAGEPVFSVSHMSRAGSIHDVSFEVRRGEIFGIGGLIGSGRTELARLIFGLDKRDSGTVLYCGRDITPDTPIQAIRRGIGFLTENRKEGGLVPGSSVRENVTLVDRTIRRPFLLNLAAERRSAERIVSRLRISTPSVDRMVMYLSGGNQQKVVLAKWIIANSKVLLFDEPTVGIDVGAKQEIYSLMDGMAAEGKAIVMITSDLTELVSISDRIGIMRKGRMVKILDRRDASKETVMRYTMGVKNE
jgi:ribose transport system ATP-binding protein